MFVSMYMTVHVCICTYYVHVSVVYMWYVCGICLLMYVSVCVHVCVAKDEPQEPHTFKVYVLSPSDIPSLNFLP